MTDMTKRIKFSFALEELVNLGCTVRRAMMDGSLAQSILIVEEGMRQHRLPIYNDQSEILPLEMNRAEVIQLIESINRTRT